MRGADVFSGQHFHEYVIGLRERIRAEVIGEPVDKLLGMDESDYIAHLEDRYKLYPIVFMMDRRTATSREERIPADRLPNIFNVHRGEAYPKQIVSVVVPYTGSKSLFLVRPSQWIMRTFRAEVSDSTLTFDVIDLYEDGDHLKRDVESACHFLEQQAENINRDTQGWNGGLRGYVSETVQKAKAEHLKRRQSDSAPTRGVIP